MKRTPDLTSAELERDYREFIDYVDVVAVEQAEELRRMPDVPETPADAPEARFIDCLTEPAVPAEVERLVEDIGRSWE